MFNGKVEEISEEESVVHFFFPGICRSEHLDLKEKGLVEEEWEKLLNMEKKLPSKEHGLSYTEGFPNN